MPKLATKPKPKGPKGPKGPKNPGPTGRFVRVGAEMAYHPAPRMRILGRGAIGPLTLIVVHEVCRGAVYGARLRRGRGWKLLRWTPGEWAQGVTRALRGGEILAVRLPREVIHVEAE